MKDLRERFISFVNKAFNSIFFFMALTIIVLAGVIYLGFGSGAKAALIEQVLHREQVISRSGALAIESFLDLTGKSLLVLASEPNVYSLEADARNQVIDFVETWMDTPLAAAILVDKEGIVKYDWNRLKKEEVGVSVADREYFAWAKTASKGEVRIFNPIISKLGATKERFIVPIATPLIGAQGNFNGAAVGVILLSELAKDYLDPLKISGNTRIYLLSEEGVILYSPIESLVGANYFDYLSQNPFLGSAVLVPILKERVVSEEEGKLDIVLLNEETKKLTRYLIAHSPIFLENKTVHWTLAVATPVDDALVFMGPIYTRQMIVFVVAFLFVLALGIRLAKIMAYRQAKEEESSK